MSSNALFRKPKSLGAFYTPQTLADMLANWLVRTGCERILEPSVGEGALIEAAVRRSIAMHGSSKIRVLACDVNPHVIETVIPHVAPDCDARVIDFLQLDPASTGLFHGVLTNPPFTRNHSLEKGRRVALRDRFSVPGAAGLWVHFLIHALEFLLPGGRLAAIIPASGLFSDYGRTALDRLCHRFANVEIREFADRPLWSNNADERGALILAEGFAQGACSLPDPKRWMVNGQPAGEIVRADAVFEQLARYATPLGTIAELRIGAVTGCNRIFLLNEDERLLMGIDRSEVRPVASRGRQIPGLTTSAAQLIERAHAGEKTWLLASPRIAIKNSGGRAQLAKISPKSRRSILWLSKRSPWWKIDVPDCDAIFTYMNDRGPRLVLTYDTVGCTNTLHSVRFNPDVSREIRLTASLSLLSSFGQLAAERGGRSYGGGVLKFELKDARGMPILPASGSMEAIFASVDAALRRGEHDIATELADEALVAPLLGRDWRRLLAALRAELCARRQMRRGR
ncbi:N-6 DNA methylase [Mesorhizobium sp. B1-1-8]|uniref:N-6 DNA methylase n=1 Tax=Mesorhizobium sp. B1-1-8 TaxID=2589976 RepID=UPI00112E70CD|nr:N-6 DNA methylase [Mesorhizobium sp. B1-1-8]UCI07217.1 SAM-dependent methyltransferase [Mesorhizobium sp. B1-1-8]